MKFQLPPNAIDLSAIKYGRLTAIRPCGRTADKHIEWLCECECGNPTTAGSNSLRCGQKRSCGCLRADAARKRLKKGGPWNEGKSYSIQKGKRCYKTKHSWAKAAIREKGNKCERCLWSEAKCDVHHKVQKAYGGLNTISNAEILCPNCHRKEHQS